jgi:ankyrin repeat protein
MQFLHTSDQESYKMTIPRPAPGTCQWVQRHPQFIQWIETSNSSFLWLTGDSGYGKSVFAAYLGKWLKTSFPASATDLQICQFFCDGNVDTQRSPVGILQGLAHQLLSQNRSGISHMQQLCEDRGCNILGQPSVLYDIILNSCTNSKAKTIFFIIDALDECDETLAMRQFIEWLVDSTSPQSNSERRPGPVNLKVFLTSRPTPFLGRNLFCIPVMRIKMEESMRSVRSDICQLIRTGMDSVQSFKALSLVQRNNIEDFLKKNADRTFLWVSIILRLLQESLEGSSVTLDEIIKGLPDELNAIYGRILSRMPKAYEKRIKLLLHIVVAARRPLSLDEANIAFNIPGSEVQEDFTYARLEPRLQPNMAQVIKGYCGAFLRIIRSKVYLLHSSAREYLVAPSSGTRYSKDPWQQCLKTEESHRILLEVCMRHLLLAGRPKYERNYHDPSRRQALRRASFEDCNRLQKRNRDSTFKTDETSISKADTDSDTSSDSISDDEAASIPFFRYAASYWPHHFEIAGVHETDVLWPMALDLCTPSHDIFFDWFAFFWKLTHTFDQGPEQNLSSLMVAAVAGLTKVTTYFLSSGVDVDAQTENGETVLHLAPHYRHGEILKMILAKRPALEGKNGHGYTPLHLAIRTSWVSGVELLLLQGANIEGKTKDGRTPLLSACDLCYNPRFASPEVARVLLQHRACPNGSRTDGVQPLHLAIEYHFLPLVNLLLEYGADVESISPKLKGSPLMSSVLDPEIIQALLDHGAKVNSTSLHGATALHMICQFGFPLGSAQVLLKGSANIEARDDDGRTPLHHSALCENGVLLLQFLLENRAEIGSKDRHGQTALHLANSENKIRLLVQHGAQLEAKTNEGLTALHTACIRNAISLVTVLLDLGADVDAGAGDAGLRPIHFCTDSAEFAVLLRLLLSRGANPNATSRSGQSALHFASSNNQPLAIKELTKSDSDMNIRDVSELTPLHYAVSRNNKDSIHALLDRGADPNCADVTGQTPLFQARDVDVLRLLIRNGADVRAKDRDGTSLLHAFVSMDRADFAAILLEKGASVDANDNDGATPLHFAKSKDTASLLLHQGADVKAMNAHGSGVLQYNFLRKDREMFEFFSMVMSSI